MTLRMLCLVIAVVLFVIATFWPIFVPPSERPSRLRLTDLGLAFFAASFAVPG